MKFLSPAKGISLGEYQQRRRQLMNAMEPGSIALIPGAGMQRRNRDIDYAFRQDSDLLYLCGFEEPDALLALIPGRSQGEVILFCRERDPRSICVALLLMIDAAAVERCHTRACRNDSHWLWPRFCFDARLHSTATAALHLALLPRSWGRERSRATIRELEI